MADLIWPADLSPYKVAFYIQPHVGGSESPFSRVRKTYALSAPRWVARLTFRAGYNGPVFVGDQEGFGARLDALIAEMEGGVNLIRFHDWRRPAPSRSLVRPGPLTFKAAVKGATTLSIAGFYANGLALSVGDYVGGDGRPHLITGGAIVTGAGTIMADDYGVATVSVKPPLSAPISAGAPCTWPVSGLFQLVGDDAGENDVEVGRPVEYVLNFVEFIE